MLYVEDLLHGLHVLVSQKVITDSWRMSFIQNVYKHMMNKQPLSTGQGDIVLKIASNHISSLTDCLVVLLTEVQYAITHPTFKLAPFTSANILREVRYVGQNKLSFRFKLDPTIVADLKALRVPHSLVDNSSSFNSEFRLWLVSVDGANLSKIQELIKKHKFSFDHDALEYITRCNNSREVKSTFVLDPDDNMIYANICDNALLAYTITTIMKGVTI